MSKIWQIYLCKRIGGPGRKYAMFRADGEIVCIYNTGKVCHGQDFMTRPTLLMNWLDQFMMSYNNDVDMNKMLNEVLLYNKT